MKANTQRFALIIAVLLSFAITFEQTWDLNDFVGLIAIESWNFCSTFSDSFPVKALIIVLIP